MVPHFARWSTCRRRPFFRRSSFHCAVAITVSVSLLPFVVGWPTTRAARGQSLEQRAGKPRPGKPEGSWPDLEELQREGDPARDGESERRAGPPPIPSMLRSPKVPLQPWNGRRVGDQVVRAHARKRVSPPPVLDDQFIQNFFSWAVLRAPNGDDPTFWNDQFRVAYGQGQASVKLAAVALGKTLFESAEYAARGRDDHWYVYDLYKTFLMREPDVSGWNYWESVVPLNGRVNVRRAFEEAPEFAGILASIVPNGSATAKASSLISARAERRNQPGGGMLARDASWSVSLLSLPGRNGLDLGLGLSYSSMVWTRSGPYIHFDEDYKKDKDFLGANSTYFSQVLAQKCPALSR